MRWNFECFASSSFDFELSYMPSEHGDIALPALIAFISLFILMLAQAIILESARYNDLSFDSLHYLLIQRNTSIFTSMKYTEMLIGTYGSALSRG